MVENKEKEYEISSSSVERLFKARESLEKFFIRVQESTQKKISRWQRKAKRTKERKILEMHEEIRKRIFEDETKVAPIKKVSTAPIVKYDEPLPQVEHAKPVDPAARDFYEWAFNWSEEKRKKFLSGNAEIAFCIGGPNSGTVS